MILSALLAQKYRKLTRIFHQHVALAVKLCSVYGQHQPLSSMARASTQQEDKMAAKKLGKNNWITYGRNMGFGIGFNISSHFLSIDLGFWYVAFEF
jgi:hypothetical protein